MKNFTLSLLIIATLSFTFALPVQAGPTGAGLPFGGYVTAVFPCTCSANFWLYLAMFYGPAPIPSGAPLVYQPGFTFLYSYYMIPVIGVWLLGDYIYVGIACVPLPSAGVINSVGTSMPAPF